MNFDNFKEYFVLIGIAVTFITSVFSLYYSRKTLKISKYIDTITTERIKWLETIRTEYSELVSRIWSSFKIFELQIENRENSVNQDVPIDAYENYFDARTDIAFKNNSENWRLIDYIQKLTLFKLRLNPIDDSALINDIDYFLNFYGKKEFHNSQSIKDAEYKLTEMTKQIQKMLKDEWEKCKKETRK